MSFRSKKELELVLSKLEGFKEALVGLEQYATPAHIAADWVWWMAMNKEVSGKTILDAASGPGILGIALLLLGAKKVYFVDKDPEIMQVCMKNYNKILEEYDVEGELGDEDKIKLKEGERITDPKAEFLTQDISLFDQEVDIVVQNPPFGTKEKHLDKLFLEKAFQVAPVVYSMHKSNTKEFVEAISRDHNFQITHFWRYQFPIKAQFHFHKKPVKNVEVGLWRLEKL